VENQYFVMAMVNPPTPIIEENGEVAFWESEKAAHDNMEGHKARKGFGYEVFCLQPSQSTKGR